MYKKRLTEEEANERDFMLGIKPDARWGGGIEYVSEITPELARDLVEKGYLDPQNRQNDAPTAKQMIDFCTTANEQQKACGIDGEWTLHGYVVSRDREDCRITLDGVDCYGTPSPEAQRNFIYMFRLADSFHYEEGYCWYC